MKITPFKYISSGFVEHFLLVLVLTVIAGVFVYSDTLWRWDNLLYDAQLSLWTRDVPEDIIIVAIDDESLNDLGRWPWPRAIHAELINKIGLESPRAIGLDIIFSEPDADDHQSDSMLAQAIKNSGKVVLPVFMSRHSVNSYPIEALPLPELTSNAAALGHVHIDISDDGIARKVYLREGIGEPHWMHYSLAMLSVADSVNDSRWLKENLQSSKQYSALQWSRESPFLIPYAGPPGHFQQIGYSQVLSGQYPRALFRNKIVLIGTTAEGLGDALPTPLSGKSGIMPGVEIVANVIDALRKDLSIRELDHYWLVVITVLMVALPLFIYPYLNPASTLMVLFGIVLSTITIVALLLWLFGLWLPVSTILLFQFISYPLWSWRRLELAMRHINAELNQLAVRQKSLSMRRERNISDEMGFISLFIPIKGWVLQTEQGEILMQQGTAPNCNLGQLKSSGWSVDGYRYWALTHYQHKLCRLGLSLGMDAHISDDEMRLLNSLIHTPQTSKTGHNQYAEDLLQAKIKQVQSVGRDYEELRRIIEDSLSAMADGVLICSGRGQVMLSNKRAGWYLFGNDNADINGLSLSKILQHVQLKDGPGWSALLKTVLFQKERILTQALHETGRDLMVEITSVRNKNRINSIGYRFPYYSYFHHIR